MSKKIYEIKISEENPRPLSSKIYDSFVVLADDFPEAFKKAQRYIRTERDDLELIIYSIQELYIIKMGL